MVSVLHTFWGFAFGNCQLRWSHFGEDGVWTQGHRGDLFSGSGPGSKGKLSFQGGPRP